MYSWYGASFTMLCEVRFCNCRVLLVRFAGKRMLVLKCHERGARKHGSRK